MLILKIHCIRLSANQKKYSELNVIIRFNPTGLYTSNVYAKLFCDKNDRELNLYFEVETRLICLFFFLMEKQ